MAEVTTDELIARLEEGCTLDISLWKLFGRAREGDTKAQAWFQTQIDIVQDYLEKSPRRAENE